MKLTYASVVLFCAFVSHSSAASLDVLKKFQSIQVVPVESHPLYIGDQTAFVGSTVAGLGMIPRSDFSDQRRLLAIGALMMLVEYNSPEQQEREAAAAAQANEILKKKGLWLPNVELAKEVAKQLSAAGLKATVSDHVRSMPTLSNYGSGGLAGLRRANEWYGNNDATDVYLKSGFDPATGIMEVGLGNYGIEHGKFYLRALLKVVEPRSGENLGRAWQIEFYDGIGREDLWAHDGAGFRSRFAQLVEKAAAGALRDLGVGKR